MKGGGYVLARSAAESLHVTEDFWNSKGEFLTKLAQTVIEGSKDGYPELEEKKEFIFKVIAKEEEQV